MNTQVLTGIMLLIIGAACGGSFGLPSKLVSREIPWEVLWGTFFFFVAILIPTTIFPLIADRLFSTCLKAGMGILIMPLLFGFLWGMGSITLGKSFAFIGLSLAYAINYGAQIAAGGLVPIIIHNPEELATPHGAVIISGVVICVLGVILCGRAAILKSKSQVDKSKDSDVPTGKKLIIGLFVAFVSGVLCACYGIAFSYGGNIMAISIHEFGNAAWQSAFVVSALILWGGSVSACGYCIVKLSQNRTWGFFFNPGISKVIVIAFIMALLHNGAILLYGVGAAKLGALGAAVGYAVFMSFAIIVGNVNGFISGEWNGASKKSVGWVFLGILILVLGVSVLTKGNFMFGEAKKISQQNTENNK